MPSIINPESFTISAGGATVTLSTTTNIDLYRILPDGGGVTLAANQTFSPTGANVEGLRFQFEYNGGVILDGNTLNIFGHVFTAAEALAKYIITATFISGQYEVKLAYSKNDGTAPIDGAEIQAGSIPASALPSAGVPLSDIAPAANQGVFILSGVSPFEYAQLDGSTDTEFPMGNGTTVNMVSMNTGATMTNTGVFSLSPGTVLQSALAFNIPNALVADVPISTAQILALNTTPVTIVPAPGVGFYIEVISASCYITFVAAAYAGNVNIDLECTGASIRQFSNPSAITMTQTGGSLFEVETTNVGGASTQMIDNAALILIQPTGDPITGDSGMLVSVNYRIVPTT